MTVLTYARYCDEIVAQAGAMAGLLPGADLATRVPTCPDWDVEQLVQHTGGAHRWAEHLVRTRAARDVPDEDVPGFLGPGGREPAALAEWFAEGAARLAATLREAGHDARTWSWGWEGTAAFWARRMTHETVVHRADTALALHGGLDAYTLDPVLAADGLDE